jgi:ribosomal protein S25
MAKKSAMELLRELDEKTAKDRQALLEQAKAEAAEGIASITARLDDYMADFSELVHQSLKRFGVQAGGRRKRGTAAAAVAVSEADVAKVQTAISKKDSTSFQLAKSIGLEPSVVSGAMQQLKAAGKVKSSGKGKGTVWTKA